MAPPVHSTDLIKVWGSPGIARPGICVISAHGGATGTTFDLPPTVVLRFYSNHGQPALLMPQNADILRIASGQYLPGGGFPQNVMGNGCHNYSLSKFEEYHQGYPGRLGTLFEAAVLKPISLVKKDPDRGTYDQIKGAVQAGVAQVVGLPGGGVPPPVNLTMDIVTVRFRPGHSDPTLDVVVRQLLTFGYTDIHCPFCRG